MELFSKQFPVSSYQEVRARSQSDWTLSVLAQSEAGDSKIRGLLLDATRVRNDHGRIPLEREKLKVSKGIDGSKIWVALLQTFRPLLAGSRMHRKNQGKLLAQTVEYPQHWQESRLVIDIRWTMKRY